MFGKFASDFFTATKGNTKTIEERKDVHQSDNTCSKTIPVNIEKTKTNKKYKKPKVLFS